MLFRQTTFSGCIIEIYSGKTDKEYCFIWIEPIIERGAKNVGSCLTKLSETYLGDNITVQKLQLIKIFLMNLCNFQRHPKACSKILGVFFYIFLLYDLDYNDIERALSLIYTYY